MTYFDELKREAKQLVDTLNGYSQEHPMPITALNRLRTIRHEVVWTATGERPKETE